MIHSTFLENRHVEELKEVFGNLLQGENVSDRTCTNNGFQTPNSISSVPIEIRNKIKDMFRSYLNNYEVNFIVDHIHFIRYNIGGFQEEHTHEKTEHYSFILYLKDGDGDTVFKTKHGEIREKPEYGKLVLFPADILHWGEVSTQGKDVMVGRFIIL